MTKPLAKAIGIAMLLLGAAFAVQKLVREMIPELVAAHPWLDQASMKTTLVLLSAAAMVWLNRGGLAGSGVRRTQKPVRWRYALGAGAALGALATSAILGVGSHGMAPILGGYGLVGLVIWIWLYSSFAEELFTRGWFQSYLAERDTSSVAPSALLFGAMHLSLIGRVDWWTVCVVVTCTTALGWLAATLRERHESLLPPIGAHIAFNVGGFLAGVIFTIAHRVGSGALPGPGN